MIWGFLFFGQSWYLLEKSKLANPIFYGVRKYLFFTSNAIILQSMPWTLLNKFPWLENSKQDHSLIPKQDPMVESQKNKIK
jgi:hypothetical protein